MFKKLALSLMVAITFTVCSFAKPARAVFVVITSIENYIPTKPLKQEQDIRSLRINGVTWQNCKIMQNHDFLQISADVDSDYTSVYDVANAIQALPHIDFVSILAVEPTTLFGKISAGIKKFSKKHPYMVSLPVLPVAGSALWKSSSSTAYKVISSALLTAGAWVFVGNSIDAKTNRPSEMPILVK